MTNRENNVKEQNVHRALAEFSQNAWKSLGSSFGCSKKLLYTVQELLKENPQLSDDLVGHIITTIDTALYQDCNNSRSSQRRNRVAPTRENLHQFDWSLGVLYSILRELNFERIYDQIDGSLFCRHRSRIFIFPGYPSQNECNNGWKFSHRQFVLPPDYNQSVKRIPFNKVQHVVHDVKDLLKILHLTDPKSEMDVGTQLCLKGRPHLVYNGPDLIWFSPVPPPKSTEGEVCPSLDPDNSRYGCFRLTVPFSVIKRKYSKVYCLGTRKYKREHCHSYLLTPDDKVVTFITKVEPIPLELSEFVAQEHPDQFYWLCYRDDPDRAWDMVDFAVSATDLNLSVANHGVRLDFVDHSNPCVPTLRTSPCNSSKTKIFGMYFFLQELKNIGIDLSKLKNIFDNEVYNDLTLLTKRTTLQYLTNT
jgi:hypothetical protein